MRGTGEVEWTRKSALPWQNGKFVVATDSSEIVVWRTAEYESEVMFPGEPRARLNVHNGLVEMWVSADSGTVWRTKADSLNLGALPVRFQGRWWSIRRAEGPVVAFQGTPFHRAGLIYDSLIVVSSLDGLDWDSVATLRPKTGLTEPYLEAAGTRLRVVGATYGPYGWGDSDGWPLGQDLAAGFANDWIASSQGGEVPFRHEGMWMTVEARFWIGSSWMHSSLDQMTTAWAFNGRSLPVQSTGAILDPDQVPHPLRVFPGKFLLFLNQQFGVASLSVDEGFSVIHALSWPGSGFHRELLWGGRILSISDAGVYLGRILSGLEGGDPRGTWVKKTETPRVF